MKLNRRHALLLLGIAAWNAITYSAFVKNLMATEGRPAGFYVAHTILIVVNLAIACILAAWGVRVWRSVG